MLEWEGVEYSYRLVLPDEFLLKSVTVTVDFKTGPHFKRLDLEA